MIYDVLIVGGGAAGLSAAQYCRWHNLSVAVVEQLAPGGQALNIVEIENIPGQIPIPGIQWAEAMERRTEELGAHFIFTRGVSLSNQAGLFTLETDDEPVQATQVIVATGVKERTPDFSGASELAGRGISYCAPCDGPFFRGKPVAVLGGGDAACEEALFLAGICSHVTMIVSGDALTGQPRYQEMVRTNTAISMLTHTKILRADSKNNPMGVPSLTGLTLLREESGSPRETQIAVSGLFVLIGGEPRNGIIAGLPGVELADGGFVKTDSWCETGHPGLFAVGALRNTPFSQIAVHISDGVLAARKAYLNHQNSGGEIHGDGTP